MKATSAVVTLAVLLSCYSEAQSLVSDSRTEVQKDKPGGEANPWEITRRGPHDNVWQSTTYETLPDGRVVPRMHSITELQTGLNFWNGTAWEESREEIDALPGGGAAALKGQHKAYFPSDIYSGFVRMIGPDGAELKSQVVGLSYSDGVDSVLIATVTNSVARILPGGSQIIYTNAFTGVKASLRYTFKKASFEQDVVLESQLPPPAKFGLSSAAYLEVVTEFFDPPTPVVKDSSDTDESEIPDHDLSFGQMRMVKGRAFIVGASEESGAVPVVKDWEQLGNRHFLFEQVPLLKISDAAKNLPAPKQSSINLEPSGRIQRSAQGHFNFPKARLAVASTNLIRTAAIDIPKGAVVLDYTTINTGLTNYTFRGEMTYYLSGDVGLYGTNSVFEGGSILKYASNVTLTVNTPVTWIGHHYRPVVMTSKDDNRIGEPAPGATGNPGTSTYAATALLFNSTTANTNLAIYNVRVLNAKTAITLNGRSGHVLSHVQILNCGNGIAGTNSDYSLL